MVTKKYVPPVNSEVVTKELRLIENRKNVKQGTETLR